MSRIVLDQGDLSSTASALAGGADELAGIGARVASCDCGCMPADVAAVVDATTASVRSQLDGIAAGVAAESSELAWRSGVPQGEGTTLVISGDPASTGGWTNPVVSGNGGGVALVISSDHAQTGGWVNPFVTDPGGAALVIGGGFDTSVFSSGGGLVIGSDHGGGGGGGGFIIGNDHGVGGGGGVGLVIASEPYDDGSDSYWSWGASDLQILNELGSGRRPDVAISPPLSLYNRYYGADPGMASVLPNGFSRGYDAWIGGYNLRSQR